MKKMLALLFALMLAVTCTAAFAETAETTTAEAAETPVAKQEIGTVRVNGAFSLQASIPEGYVYHTLEAEEGVSFRGQVTKPEDPNAPSMLISICLNDSYGPGVRLNDLDEEALKGIEASFQEQNEVKLEYRETAHGTKVLLVTETGDDPDFVDFYSVYEGYEVEMILGFQPGAENPVLTEKMINTAIQFLSDLDFVKTE